MPMQTLRLKADGKDREPIETAAGILRKGGIVAFPTETVYGLGGNGLNPETIRRIFEVKGRPQDNPVILHIPSPEMLAGLAANIPAPAERLIENFWPGPLTLVLPRHPDVPLETTAGLDSIGIRIPDHPIALDLIRSCGFALAAPSANLSGRPSPTRAEHVIEDLDGRIDAVLDCGSTRLGIESTVLDLTTQAPTILRPGGVSLSQLREIVPEIRPLQPDDNEPVKSPGTKYKHYAPRAELILIEGDAAEGRTEIEKRLADSARTAVLTTTSNHYRAAACHFLGSTPDQIGPRLFDLLRQLDRQGVERILVELPHETQLDDAIINRLRKAAGQSV